MKRYGVPSGYVEGLNDARAPLADFFSLLLGECRPCRISTVSYAFVYPLRLSYCEVLFTRIRLALFSQRESGRREPYATVSVKLVSNRPRPGQTNDEFEFIQDADDERCPPALLRKTFSASLGDRNARVSDQPLGAPP
jgi:hypothetical protein